VNFGAANSFMRRVDCRRMTVITSARSRSPSRRPSCMSMTARRRSGALGSLGRLSSMNARRRLTRSSKSETSSSSFDLK
jgi:hypothetical protein